MNDLEMFNKCLSTGLQQIINKSFTILNFSCVMLEDDFFCHAWGRATHRLQNFSVHICHTVSQKATDVWEISKWEVFKDTKEIKFKEVVKKPQPCEYKKCLCCKKSVAFSKESKMSVTFSKRTFPVFYHCEVLHWSCILHKTTYTKQKREA